MVMVMVMVMMIMCYDDHVLYVLHVLYALYDAGSQAGRQTDRQAH